MAGSAGSTVPASDPLPRTRVWAIRVSTLAWAALFLALLCGLPVMLAVSWWTVPALLLLAALLAAPCVYLWRRASARSRHRPWRRSWLLGTAAWMCVLCGVVALPFYYLAISTETRPAIVPTVTLVKGDRTVVLQGMQHVGSERFFKTIVYDLEEALSDGFMLFYEGVANADADANAWFTKTLSGGKDLGDNYRMLGKVCGLGFQNDFMGPVVADARLHPERHLTVDVTTRGMKDEYDRLMQSDPAFAAEMQKRASAQEDESSEASDFLTPFLERQKGGDTRQTALAGTLCRGIMTFVMRRASEPKGEPMDRVVLDYRNKVLTDRLLSDTKDKIYVTYGAAHLPGVAARMQKEAGWQVKSIKWMRTIAAPEHLEGQFPNP